jgi:hypothetical protein
LGLFQKQTHSIMTQQIRDRFDVQPTALMGDTFWRSRTPTIAGPFLAAGSNVYKNNLRESN